MCVCGESGGDKTKERERNKYKREKERSIGGPSKTGKQQTHT